MGFKAGTSAKSGYIGFVPFFAHKARLEWLIHNFRESPTLLRELHETQCMTLSPTELIAKLEPSLIVPGRDSDYVAATGKFRASATDHTRIYWGAYLPNQLWDQLTAEAQHLARMLAAQQAARGALVFSHKSAAVLLGLPIYGELGSRVHVVGSVAASGKSTRGVVRHRADLLDEDVVEVSGLMCTSPDRTILDLARFEPAETALAAADGYLRREFKVSHKVDWSRVFEWQDDMVTRIGRIRGRNGAAGAQRLIALADPRIDSVLESISHLQLKRLKFEVEIQVPVPAPHGRMYYVDFELLGLDLFGECDGKQKYLDARLRRGRTAAEVVYDEKRRQDWICKREHKDMVRWGYPEVPTARKLGMHLMGLGVPVPRMPR